MGPAKFLETIAREIDELATTIRPEELSQHLAYTFAGCLHFAGQLRQVDRLQEQIVHFEFRRPVPEEMIEFGTELCRHGIVPLPGEVALLSWPEITVYEDGSMRYEGFMSHCCVVDITDRQWGGIELFPDSRGMRFSRAATFKPHGKQLFIMGLCSIGSSASMDTLGIVDVKTMFENISGTYQMVAAPVLEMKYKMRRKRGQPVPKFALQAFRENPIRTLSSLLGCLGLLSSKVVKVTNPPEKEVRRRLQHPSVERRQRPTIYVDLVDAARAAGGRTHARPQPHFRRGHVRRLDGGSKLVVVAPTIVNATDGAKVELKKYVAKN